MRRIRRKKSWTEEELIALAAEPVPYGSGITEFGRGKRCYIKTALDGSMRCFRFETLVGAQRAMAAGIQADVENEAA